MAITVVQAPTPAKASAATSLSITLSSTTSGNLLVVGVVANPDSTPGAPTVTVKLGTTSCTRAENANNGAFINTDVWYLANIPGSQTTVTATSSVAAEMALFAYEISGCATSSPLDQVAGATATGSPWSSTATATLSQASEIAIGVQGGAPSAASYPAYTGPGSPWTNTATVQIGTSLHNAAIAGYDILSATTAVTYNGTATNLGNNGTVVATFKAATTGTVALTAPNLVLSAPLLTPSAPATVALTTPGIVLAAPAVTPGVITPPKVPVGSYGLTAEINVGEWTDITSYIYHRDTVQLQRGRQNEASTTQPGQASMTLRNNDARFTTRNPAGAYYPDLVQNTPLRLSVPAADAGLTTYLRLETDQASQVSCPDSSGLQITSGTLSVRWDGQITDWSETSKGNGNLYNGSVLMAKWGLTAQAWGLWFNGDGTLTFWHYDGSAGSHESLSTAPVPYYNARIALRADYNISAQTITFYTAPTMAGSWTQLGGVQVTSATSQASGAGQAVTVGNGTATVAGFTELPGMYGSVYEAQILASGTVKADPVFTSQTAGATSFADAQGNTWSLNGTAELSGRLYRFHGELSSVPKAALPNQHDIYSQATAYGVTQRLQNANQPLSSPLYRAYLRLPSDLNLAAYWPCEDGTSATSIGSAVGSAPMQILTIAGNTPELAANSDFACSSPIPAMNGGSLYAKVPSGVSFTDAVIRALVSIPAGGDTSNAVILQALYSGGTVAYADLVYGSVGPDLTMNAYNAAGSLIYSMGPVSGLIASGGQYRVSMNLKKNGTGVDMEIETLVPGASAAATFTHTLASSAVGAVTVVQTGPCMSAMGHISVQGVWDQLFDLNDYQPPSGGYTGALNAWAGEPAAVRVARLCAEEGIGCRIIGPPDLSMPMGYQSIDTLIDILQECENTDLGMLFEPRQALGLGYRTRTSLYHQPALCTASFPARELSEGFGSTGDTQLTVNDVTATAPDGSTARQFLATGAMSVQNPPDGIGRISTEIEPNPQLDAELNQLAAWYLSVRSVDDDRYPAISFQMARASTPQSVLLLDIGDYQQLTGTPAWVPPPPVSQLAAGFAETYFPVPYWLIQVNGIPELPYETAVFDTARFDTGGSTLTSNVSSSATSFSVTLGSGVRRWTTTAGSFPFDIVIDREQMTVTGITGTGPQTFTVTRSVNGVTIPHSAGAAVALYHKPVLAL